MGSILLIIVTAGLLAAIQIRKFRGAEARLLTASFLAHMVGSFLQFATQEYYYGVSDAHAYMDYGEFMARLVEVDFSRFAPEVLKVILHMQSAFPAYVAGDVGSSSSTMAGLAAPVCYLFGPSLLAACVVTSVLGWFGQLFLYRVACEELREADRSAAGYAILLMPSVVFWGSGFNKEAFAFAGLGALCFSCHQVVSHGKLRYIPMAILGTLAVGLIKPYILFPFVLGLSAWIYVARAGSSGRVALKPVYLGLAAVVAIMGLLIIGQIFPEFAVSNVAQSAATQQELWTQGEGGSTLQLGSGDATTIMQQLPFIPLAIVNALFRPFLFEARNPPMLGAALETTLLAVVSVQMFARFKLRRAWEILLETPLLVASTVFVLTFSIAVGLTASNLGSLSRYRMPMIPLYAMLLFVMRRRLGAEPSRESPKSAAEGARRSVGS